MDELLFSDLDRAFADFLVERSGLSSGKRERLWSLVAGLSRALGEGHSCLPLSPADQELLHGLPLVGDGRTATPLVLYRGLLYLQRYFHYERHLASAIARLAKTNLLPTGERREASQEGFLSGQDEAQQRAVTMAGGPSSSCRKRVRPTTSRPVIPSRALLRRETRRISSYSAWIIGARRVEM